MAGVIFLSRPDIEHDDVPLFEPADQGAGVDRFSSRSVFQVRLGEPVDLGQARLTQITDGLPEAENALVGKAVVNAGTVPPGFDETSLPKHLEVLRGVGDAKRNLASDILDTPLTLGEEIDDFEAVRAGDRFPDPGELVEKWILEGPMRSIHTFKRILE